MNDSAYIGEVRMFGFNYAPDGWALCDGRVVPIVGNVNLFSLLGATFGGDGRTNFALPDLRAMVAPFKPLTFGIATNGFFPSRSGDMDSEFRPNPYAGEVRMFGFNYDPDGWALCDGRLLPIAKYELLYLVLGTAFGGDGKTNFALPDLRAMVAPFKPLTFCIATSGFPPNPGFRLTPYPAAYVGEVRMFGYNLASIFSTWATCDGRLLPSDGNALLYAAIGTAFGGDGKTSFALPDLRAIVSPFKPLTFCISEAGEFPQKPSGR
jgi:microcystin-dependent protein